MSHQKIAEYNPDTEEFDLEVDVNALPIERAWAIGHYGGSGESWRQKGDVSIRRHEAGSLGGGYLECRIDETPFFSIVADEDQWGTWYTLKLDDGEGAILKNIVCVEDDRKVPDPEGRLIYGQEWGTPSFLKALGTALIEFSDMMEARTGPYAHTDSVTEIAQTVPAGDDQGDTHEGGE